MQDKIIVLTYQLNLIVRRLDKIVYNSVHYDVEQQIRIISEKIYEISDAIEAIEIILEDDQIDTKDFN